MSILPISTTYACLKSSANKVEKFVEIELREDMKMKKQLKVEKWKRKRKIELGKENRKEGGDRNKSKKVKGMENQREWINYKKRLERME